MGGLVIVEKVSGFILICSPALTLTGDTKSLLSVVSEKAGGIKIDCPMPV